MADRNNVNSEDYSIPSMIEDLSSEDVRAIAAFPGDWYPLLREVAVLPSPLVMRSWRIKGLMERAVTQGNLQALIMLKEKGAEFRYRTEDGYSLVHRAAASGQDNVILFLLQEGLDVNDRWVYWETTPLHMAAQENQTSTCRLLVLLGADPDASDSRGRTPLHIAAMQGARETCVFLILVGASLRRKDRDGKTPIAYTTSNQRDPDLRSFFYKAILHTKDCTMCSKKVLKLVYTN